MTWHAGHRDSQGLRHPSGIRYYTAEPSRAATLFILPQEAAPSYFSLPGI